MKKIMLFLIFFYVSIIGFSQFTIGGGYAGTLPLASFNREGYEFGNGIDFHILTTAFPRETKYRFQFGIDFNNFNSRAKSGVYSFISNGNVYTANHKYTNSHVAFGLKFRLLKDEERFRHHFDIDFGSRSFSTLREVSNVIPADQVFYTPVSTLKLSNSSYLGITLGSMYKLTRWLFLDLYTRVDFGKSAEWYDLNSLKNIDNITYCDTKTTETPLLWFGATLSFQIKLKKRTQIENTPNDYPKSPRREYPRTPPPVENRSGEYPDEPEEENKTNIFKTIWKVITVIDGAIPKKEKEKERKPVESN